MAKKQAAQKATATAPASGKVSLVSTGIVCIALGGGEEIPHNSKESFVVTAAQAKRLIAKGYAKPSGAPATPPEEDGGEDEEEGEVEEDGEKEG
jgi:hypothetical protein